MSNFKDHRSTQEVDNYVFRLDLSDGAIKFSPEHPRKFALRVNSSQETNHTWHHENTESGSIKHKGLNKHLNKKFRSADDEVSNFRVASLPASMFKDGFDSDPHGPHLLFKFKQSKTNANNDLVIEGKLLGRKFVREHRDMLTGAFGADSIHTTLQFDTTHFYDLSVSQGPSSTSNVGPLKRIVDSNEDQEGRGPLFGWFDDAFETVTAPVSTVISTVEDTANDTVDTVKDAANDTVDTVKDAANDTVDAVEDTANDTVDTVADAANDTADFAEDTANDTADLAEDVANETVDAVEDAASATGDWFKGAASSTVNFTKGATASVVNLANDIYDALSGEQTWPFSLEWPKIKYNKKFPDEDAGPFNVSFKFTPHGSGQLELKNGIVGTLIKPDSASFEYTQNMDMHGEFDLVKPKWEKKRKFTLGEIAIPASDPPIVNGFVATLEVDVKADLDFDSKHLTLGATLDLSPGATLTLGGGETGLKDASEAPKITTHIPDFNKAKPVADFSLVVTPSLDFVIGPSVPGDVPYVGGTTIFGVDLNLSNPLTLDWKSCEPDAIILGTGGKLTSNAYFMNGKLEPGFLDKDLYGPLSHTIDTGFTDINCEDPVPSAAAIVSGVDQGVYMTYLS